MLTHGIYFVDSGPLLALALARQDAVTGWREMLGPKELDKAKEEAPERLVSVRMTYCTRQVY